MDVLKSLDKTARFYANFERKRILERCSPRQLGAWSKNELAKMGPTFIKIGQFVSTRSDVFGKELTDELKSLQDSAAPLDWKDVRAAAPQTLPAGAIEEAPIASASIGQVHLATYEGKRVVVKLKRPNIDAQIRADFQGLLAWIRFMKTFSKDRRIFEFEILFTEYYKLLLEEIDFKKEAENITRFQKMFEKTPWIKVPALVPELTTDTCVAMEYVPSIKIDDVEALKSRNLNPSKIATKLIECYVEQIIRHGYVHIDPHPGNVGMTDRSQIVFYDYGMVLEIDEKIQAHFDDLLVALYDRNIDAIARLVVDVGLIVVEPKNLVHLKKFLLFFLTYIEKMDFDDFKVSYLDTMKTSDMPFLISSKFLLLLRGLSILEGNCKALDPSFNYKKTLDPYIQDTLIDIQYLENKAIVDLKSMQNFGSKLKEQEIEMEILRSSIASQATAKRSMKAPIVGGAIMLAAFFAGEEAAIAIGFAATFLFL